MSKKIGFDSIKVAAKEIAKNPDAQKFVKNATPSSSTAPKPASSNTRKLVVDGQLSNRDKTCRKPIQLYIKNDIANWIEDHCSAGRGGQQIMLNYLIRAGIEKIEQQFEESGVIFTEE